MADTNVSPLIGVCQNNRLFNVLHGEMQTAEMLGFM